MAIKIAIANQKGGVGKTTTALNIADALRHAGYSVLMLDLDPQHNSTDTYRAEIDGVNTIVDVLKKDVEASEAIQHTLMGDIIAGDSLMSQEEDHFNSRNAREYQLKRVLTPIEKNYDYIIMDTPPNLGIYMKNALSYADGCVVPIRAEQFSVDGLAAFLQTIGEIKEDLNPDLMIYGVLLSIYDTRNGMDKGIHEVLPSIGAQNGFNVFKTAIRTSQDVKKSQGIPDEYNEDGTLKEKANRSLFENYPQSKAASDYIQLVKEIMEVIANGK